MIMKLKHLFENPHLAEMLCKNWEYETDSLELFQYFRISANAIYPFRQNGGVCFLRCCPVSEKSKGAIAAELEYLGYLRSRQYPACEPVPARNGDLWVQKATPWGEYYACVFKQVEGSSLSESDFDDPLMFSYGAALGRLHQCSSEYSPAHFRRWTHLDVFAWMEKTLPEPGLDGLALEELKLLRESFAGLPVTPGNYGLIHYDFEPDNVFYDQQTGTVQVIDFDDALYHWYVMDVAQALHSLAEEIPQSDLPRKTGVFLDGYRSEYAIDARIWNALPLFRRFANIYRYLRIARAVQERWENEPGWMSSLRLKLSATLESDAAFFGKALDDA